MGLHRYLVADYEVEAKTVLEVLWVLWLDDKYFSIEDCFNDISSLVNCHALTIPCTLHTHTQTARFVPHGIDILEHNI